MSEQQARVYTVPKDVWDECICIIRGHERLKAEYDLLIQLSPPPPDGQPKSRYPGDPTGREAIRLGMMAMRINAVDEAFTIIPLEYRQAIRDKIVKRREYPDYAHRATYCRWKARMIKYLAERLLFI